ncbi:MAG: hypothetical protein U0169_27720 [Polyangiaceae bacterium]
MNPALSKPSVLRSFGLAFAVTALLAPSVGCGKIRDKIVEKAAEKAAEKAIESQTGGEANLDAKNGSLTIKGKDGAEATVTGGGNAKIPENFPKTIPIYKGSKVTASMSSKQGNKAFTMVTLGTSDDPDTVAKYYKGELGKMKSIGEFSTGEMHTMTFQDAAAKNSVSVTVARSPGAKETQVTLTSTTDAT